MISVGIERNVPIRSSAIAIGQIYAYISIQIRSTQVSVARLQGSWISGYYPSSLSILKPELRCLIAAESGYAICMFFDMTVHKYHPN